VNAAKDTQRKAGTSTTAACQWADDVHNRNPFASDDEIIILTAIRNAPPRGVATPGDKIRATGINRQQFEYVQVITGGMLPLEALPGTGKE
jgi:hypothetical protein